MEYILKRTEDNRMVLLKNGEEVPMTDVLNVYPERRVYALNGKMGAGKTTFTKQLCEELGTMDIVNSPTFAIVNVYEDGQGEEIYHFDCYRLKNLAEAMDLGAEEYLYSGRYCFIEWPDVLEPILPEDTVEITFTVTDNGDRVLRL
jgi:tRNA threonylcarbamoyladenosine biosynthesis protein TsaE